MGSGVRDVMESLGYDEREGYGSAGKLAGVWVAGERGAQKKVAGALQKAQLPIEEVMAKTLEGEIDSFERVHDIRGSDADAEGLELTRWCGRCMSASVRATSILRIAARKV